VLGDRIGVGGMSHVHRAKEQASGTPVAVKILLPRLARDPKSRALFESESDLLCRLKHPNLVRGFYHFSADGLFYLVMELVDAPTALERLDRDGPFGETEALAIILQAARALEYLHHQGLVHRDVKPGNLLVARDGGVKLCDLGFAVMAGQEATCSGTVQYLAPEQAVGERVLDTRADIYALGVTLFQLTMGKLPFDGATDEEQLSRRVFDELRAKEQKGIGVSQHLHYFIQKMMARERDVRYQTPGDLIADIQESLEGRSSLERRTFGDRAAAQRNANRLASRRRPASG
jgi:serine/threonine-protein kinase